MATKTVVQEATIAAVAQLRIQRQDHRLGGADSVTYQVSGTAAQLIEHGLCEPSHFPPAPKRVASSNLPGLCSGWTLRKGRGLLWNLFAYCNRGVKLTSYERAYALFADAALSPEPEAELFEDRREGETNYSDRLFLQLAFKHGPMDLEGARDEVIHDVERSISMLKKSLERYTGPFVLKPNEEEAEDLEEAIETIRRLAHYGRLARDHAMSERIARYRGASAAREDKPLQNFLAECVGAAE